MFPVGGPNPSPEDMNYTVVINGAVWGGALAYYFIGEYPSKTHISCTLIETCEDAHKWFKGPKITLDVDILTEEQIEGLKKEGLEINGIRNDSDDAGMTGKEKDEMS